MYAVTLRPGSWPPSPGFEPWAILISSWSARARYVGGDAEPRRGDLLDPRVRGAGRPAPGAYQAGSSPPSPVFAEPPSALDPDRQCLVGLGATARRRSSPTRRTAGRSSARPRPLRAARTLGSADVELVTRSRRGPEASSSAPAVASRASCQRARRRAIGWRPRQELDLARDHVARTGAPRRRLGSARSRGRAAAARGRAAGGDATAASRRRMPLAELVERRPPGPRRGRREAARDHVWRQVDGSMSAPPM